MCTVSYVPSPQGFVLTSNRDERAFRLTDEPTIYSLNGTYLCYPKDVDAGGTWIAASENGRVCCLLNGAFHAHTKQQWHTHSRGKILLDIASYFGDPNRYFNEADLSYAEPFTVILLETKFGLAQSVFEYVWDGQTVTASPLDKDMPRIWSSSTLYPPAVKLERQYWFTDFLSAVRSRPSKDDIYRFHSGTHTDDTKNNVIMSREGALQTVSITQVSSAGNKLEMKYFDMLKDTSCQILI